MSDDQLPDETEGVERFLFANFCKASFTKWFDGSEEFPEEEQALRDRFGACPQTRGRGSSADGRELQSA